jgi:hypothetical protein
MLRFTIRDVLWLTVVVALGVGWWENHQQLALLRWRLDRTGRNLSWLEHYLAGEGVIVDFTDEDMRLLCRDPRSSWGKYAAWKEQRERESRSAWLHSRKPDNSPPEPAIEFLPSDDQIASPLR